MVVNLQIEIGFIMFHLSSLSICIFTPCMETLCPAGVTLPAGRHVDQRLLWPL